MANEIIRPSELPAASEVFTDASLVVDSGTSVQKATPQQIVDAATILAVDVATTGGSTVQSVLNRLVAESRNVKDFGAVGDGVADDTSAFQMFISHLAAFGRKGRIPAGDYRLSGKLLATAPIHIEGDGQDKTFLRWTSGASSSGIEVQSSSPRMSTVSGMNIETFKVASGSALKFDYSGCISGGVILPRARSHVRIDNVIIQGSTSYTTNGWNIMLELVSCMGITVGGGCRFLGVYTGAYGSMPQSAAGIRAYGAGSPVQLVCEPGMFISAVQTAVHTSDFEGVYISPGFEFVTVGCGVKTTNTANESGMVVTGGHIATVSKAFDLQRMAEFVISDNIIYSVNDVTPLTYVDIGTGCNDGRVQGNIFRQLGSVSAITGVSLGSGCSNITIGKNTFDLGAAGTPISVNSGASRPVIYEQEYSSGSSAQQIVGSSTTMWAEVLRGFSGDLNTIYADWRKADQTILLVGGVTNAPPLWTSTAGGIVRQTAFDANTAVQTAIHPNIANQPQYVRRKSGGVWGTWG